MSVMYEDKLEVRYKLDSSRDAEVLRSSVRNVANGQLHTVTIKRLTDSVSVQVKTPHQQVQRNAPRTKASVLF